MADIKEHGQREPITLHDGAILDGRNRWRACTELGITPATRPWDGKGSPVAFVISLNLQRRHLSAGQKAAIAVEALPLFEAEALDRKREAGRSAAPGRPAEKDVAIVPQVSPDVGRAREQAASTVGVSPRYVQDAKRIKEEAPALFEEVKAGVTSLPRAVRQVEREQNAYEQALKEVAK